MLKVSLRCASPEAWLQAVLSDFDSFLQDHADCERKASAMALSFVAKYHDRKAIIADLIDLGIEELEHFREVYAEMEKRGIPLPASMGKDPYLEALLKLCRTGRDERFLDRLLIAGLVEQRGAERFRLVAENVGDPEMQRFYKHFWTSEAKHGVLFLRLAANYFSEEEILSRLAWWEEREAEIIQALPPRAALH